MCDCEGPSPNPKLNSRNMCHCEDLVQWMLIAILHLTQGEELRARWSLTLPLTLTLIGGEELSARRRELILLRLDLYGIKHVLVQARGIFDVKNELIEVCCFLLNTCIIHYEAILDAKRVKVDIDQP